MTREAQGANMPLAGKRVTVMGLGNFGGGLGATQFLTARGARVTVTDLRSQSELADSLAQLDQAKIERLVLGEHRAEDFTQADLIVVNPAVRPVGNRFLELAAAQGVPLTSEINLFWQNCRARKIVVTGSVGKSTTATLIHHILIHSGLSARLGGNIGISLLPIVDEIDEREWVVLELSSFQLSALDCLRPRPEIAVITNCFPNHLDWHGTFEDYHHAKQTILRWQTAADVAILNADDPLARNWQTVPIPRFFGHANSTFSPHVTITPETLRIHAADQHSEIPIADLPKPLQAAHHVSNVAAALSVTCVALGISTRDAVAAMQSYHMLRHRFDEREPVAGRRIINDSKATTPEATIAAIESVQAPIILIAGGKDKGADFSALIRLIVRRVKSVVLLGETAALLERLLQSQRDDDIAMGPVICRAANMDAAVSTAFEHSQVGDAILLSPGCASDAEFLNFERRGAAFENAVTRFQSIED